MNEFPGRIGTSSSPVEGIDVNKLRIISRKNIAWIILIFIACNLGAFLFLRWTKDLFESSSELKLDVKQDATEMGIKNFVDDQNVNMVAGEIEQIRSKVFFNLVIDSMDLGVSYFSEGNVLHNELYKNSPFQVKYHATTREYFDHPFYFNFNEGGDFTLRFGEKGVQKNAHFDEPVKFPGLILQISKRPANLTSTNEDYSFVINSREGLVQYLSKNITVAPLNFDANTISISFQDFNPLKAYDITNNIDSLYIQYSYQQKNLANKQKIEWLNNELNQVEQKMGDFENYFENFTLQNKSTNLAEDLKKTIIMINRIDSQRFELTKRITSLDELIESLNKARVGFTFTHKPFLPEYINRKLEELEKMLEDQDKVGIAYTEKTMTFRKNDQQMIKYKATLFSQLAELKSSWMKTESELTVRKGLLEKEFAGMPDKNTQYSKKQRFYKLYEEFYLTMMQSKSEFEISQAGSTPDFKVLSTASLPTVPIKPQRWMIRGIGFVASIILSLFFIGILYVINNKITSVAEIESTIAIPVLGTIPISHHHPISAFHVIDNPKSSVSESIRSLRTNLDFFTTGGTKKVISVSSTISGEGKSYLAMNLGAVIAMSHKKVVLLDLDMRKTKVELPVEIKDATKGVSTVLIKKNTWQECVVKTGLETFDFIPSGPHPPNPSELLLNGEFSSLLEELKAEYDVILIDTPPVGLVTDGIMAMKRSDLSIYVFRANYSKKEFLQNLQRIISINKLERVATVLNAVPTTRKGNGYGYYEDETLSKRERKKNI